MSAPVGNQFWKQRSKHGRDTLFSTPEKMWEAACEYFEWCDKNPLIEVVHDKLKVNGVGDELKFIDIPKMRPYTIQGLCLYLDCNTQYFNQFKSSEKAKEQDFSFVITRIEEIIYNQKFSGAAAGFLNPNIIARDLGLADKKDVAVSVEQPLFGDDDESTTA